jgi:hypothetical protein
MRNITARIAIMEQQMGVAISSDRKSLEGFLFANLLNDVIQAGHLDPTFQPITDNIGACDENNYYGAYKLLYENVSDASLFMPSDANCDRMSPFEAASVVIDHSNDILMLRKLITRKEQEDNTKLASLMGSTPPSIGLILFAFMITILIGILIARHVRVQLLRVERGQSTKTGSKRQLIPTLTLLLATAIRQPFMIRSKSGIARVLFYLYCWLAIMFLQYFSGDFKTDLMIKKPTETIETLQDLAGSERYRALFPLEWNLWRRFLAMEDPVMKTIWMKATRGTGKPEDGTISMTGKKNNIDPMEMLNQMREGRVFICDKNINRFLVNGFCLGYDKDNADNMTEIIHTSRLSFFPSLLMGIMRVDAPKDFKDRFNFILTCFNEHGFHDFYVKNPFGINKQSQEQKDCFRRMRRERMGDDSGQDVTPIKWGNISRLVLYSSALLIIAVISLLIEFQQITCLHRTSV